MALHHFNKTRLVANGLVRRAEEVLGSAGRADEGTSLRAAKAPVRGLQHLPEHWVCQEGRHDHPQGQGLTMAAQ